MSQRVQRS